MVLIFGVSNQETLDSAACWMARGSMWWTLPFNSCICIHLSSASIIKEKQGKYIPFPSVKITMQAPLVYKKKVIRSTR